MAIKCPICQSENRTTIGITGALPMMSYKYVCKDCDTIYQYDLETKVLDIKVLAEGIPFIMRK